MDRRALFNNVVILSFDQRGVGERAFGDKEGYLQLTNFHSPVNHQNI